MQTAWRQLQGVAAWAWRTMHCGVGSSKQRGNGGCSRVVEDECGRQVLPGRACKLVAELKGAWRKPASAECLLSGTQLQAMVERANLVSQGRLA